ncbi:hypothetical protein [Streptomyces sp. NPDC005322]|uniref:hypothetical protein n=1 Tax=Streptomyces sp. NPDC005322 TaxID=3157032 RepID=UPI0033AE4B0B
MSTEDTDTPQTPDDDIRQSRRRSPLAVVSVAAAVLVAGGGGAYWASTATDGGTAPGAARKDGSPKPLALDAYASRAGQAGNGGDEGIAPGEPDPNGGRYVATGKLPDGPGSAPVYPTDPKVTKADVARLAKALDVAGSPRADHGFWKVGGPADGNGPALRVSREGPGAWSYSRYGAPGGDSCVHPGARTDAGTTTGSAAGGGGASEKGCPSYRDGAKHGDNGAGEGSDKAVSQEKAERAAEPVLKALGLSDAKLDARGLYGAVRMVNAEPKVGALPTQGWTTSLEVGADGQLVGGSGMLSTPRKADSYPLIGADEALKKLNAAAAKGRDTSGKVMVRKATFGLAAHMVDGRRALVPSWIFETRPTGTNGVALTLPYPAVKPEFIKKAGTTPGQGQSSSRPGKPGKKTDDITSYSADGKTLTLRFWGGVCNTYSVSAKETSKQVTVDITSKPTHPGRACILIAKQLEKKVTLDKPLDGRKVVDRSTGETLPPRK